MGSLREIQPPCSRRERVFGRSPREAGRHLAWRTQDLQSWRGVGTWDGGSLGTWAVAGRRPRWPQA